MIENRTLDEFFEGLEGSRPLFEALRTQVAALVLSVALGRRDDSPRWKGVVEPAPRRFMHHLELYDAVEIDSEVDAWLWAEWGAAG